MGLVVKNVNKSFGDKHVVDNISFELKKPGVFGLLGTNGAGKTTTIRMILGMKFKTFPVQYMKYMLQRISIQQISRKMIQEKES